MRLAIAACLFIAGGVIEHVRHKAEEAREYADANQGLLVAMVKSHGEPADGADAQPVSDVTEARRVRDELSSRLSHQPPLPDLNSLGWSLKTAAVRPLQGAVAARITFAHGDRHATLFSLPRFALTGATDGHTYDLIVDGHPISGYVTADGVHCIVGDAATPLADITALRKHLQQL
ncbi:MAG: hypothetical protein QOF78_106 [Phycisphaerales bacterium]|jgi:hypothetical protein|nr:hypothetical protein [Phycisphaerales bacterium]